MHPDQDTPFYQQPEALPRALLLFITSPKDNPKLILTAVISFACFCTFIHGIIWCVFFYVWFILLDIIL